MSEQPVPVERSEVHASGDAAEFMLKQSYVDFRPTASAHEEEFKFDLRRTAAGDIVLDHLAYSMAMSIRTDPLPRMYFFFPTQGRFDFTSRGLESLMQTGDAFLWPVGAPLQIEWSPYRAELISVPVDVTERVAAGRDTNGPVRFLGWAPVSTAADRLWRSTAGFVASQLESAMEPLSQPLAHSRALDLLGEAALQTFPNTTMTQDYLPGPGQMSPTALRRAVDHIEANADSPIALSDIAGAASTSPGTLTHAFDLHYGFGPMEYLRRVRLERAHRDLRMSDPSAGATVASIAARWGFLNPRRFSSTYRESYGQSPAQTLHF